MWSPTNSKSFLFKPSSCTRTDLTRNSMSDAAITDSRDWFWKKKVNLSVYFSRRDGTSHVHIFTHTHRHTHIYISKKKKKTPKRILNCKWTVCFCTNSCFLYFPLPQVFKSSEFLRSNFEIYRKFWLNCMDLFHKVDSETRWSYKVTFFALYEIHLSICVSNKLISSLKFQTKWQAMSPPASFRLQLS